MYCVTIVSTVESDFGAHALDIVLTPSAAQDKLRCRTVHKPEEET